MIVLALFGQKLTRSQLLPSSHWTVSLTLHPLFIYSVTDDPGGISRALSIFAAVLRKVKGATASSRSSPACCSAPSPACPGHSRRDRIHDDPEMIKVGYKRITPLPLLPLAVFLDLIPPSIPGIFYAMVSVPSPDYLDSHYLTRFLIGAGYILVNSFVMGKKQITQRSKRLTGRA